MGIFDKLKAKIFGDPNERELQRLWPVVHKINSLEPEVQRLSDSELRGKTLEVKARIELGESLDQLLPEAYAVVREAARRTLNMRHFDVQLLGGIVLHEGKIAEMATGEGKTLVATLPAYLNALLGRGVHIVTVNDYLAKRDTQWMGPIYHALGLTVGCIQHEASFIYDPNYHSEDPRYEHLRPVTRREAYEADITYGTNHEFGFDYLRDNMALDLSQCVQRELFYAIVDEVDNILIDEARTPLIISGPSRESTQIYYLFAQIAARLKRDEDYLVDEKYRIITLTDKGISRVEKWLKIENLYSPEHEHLVHYLENALRAKELFKRDRDYVVRDGEVIIVDEFTGRLMFGRRYSDGLHQAIEAKERVKVKEENVVLATITFQNYFRMYKKLAGMTGTAATEAQEFHEIYGLDVVVIPTNKPLRRIEYSDVVYKTERAKFNAVVREIEECYKKGRPVLVGTTSVEKSEYLSELLKRRGIPHQVLNAKHHEKEAMIIAQAGRLGAVTIATNMAGRGVDIILGGNPKGRDPKEWEEEHKKVVELGGLHVIGTERHEARRIDNQLRGRAGRQGDPGSSRFYVSLEDELLRRFGGEQIKRIMDWLGIDEDTPIEHPMVTKAITQAQIRSESYHFEIRKHLVEYDDVLNKHREVIYGERRKILEGIDLKANILNIIEEEIKHQVQLFLPTQDRESWNLEGLVRSLSLMLPSVPSPESLSYMDREEIEEKLLEHAHKLYEEKEREFGPENMRLIERVVMLRSIDQHWIRHLTAMENLRQGIGLYAYAHIDPLVAYKKEGQRLFNELIERIRRTVAYTIFRASIVRKEEREKVAAAVPRSKRKIGRNDPCPCGSGKKYKYCCGRNA